MAFFAWRDFARVTGERFGQCGRFGFDATDEDAAVNFRLYLSCPSFRIGARVERLDLNGIAPAPYSSLPLQVTTSRYRCHLLLLKLLLYLP